MDNLPPSCLFLHPDVDAPNEAQSIFSPSLLCVSDPVLHLPTPVQRGYVRDQCLSGFVDVPVSIAMSSLLVLYTEKATKV